MTRYRPLSDLSNRCQHGTWRHACDTCGFVVSCSYVLWHDGCRCQLVINAIDDRREW